MKSVILFSLIIASPVAAEDRVQFPTATERHVADIASWGTVAASIALDTRASWQCADRRRCFVLQGVRAGVTLGAAELVKRAIHRDRPDGSDDMSFYSEHTAWAFQAIGGPSIGISIPLAISTGGLRVAAGKHWLSDAMVGAGVGFLTSRIR